MEQEKKRATTRNTPTGSRSSRRGCRSLRARRSIASLWLAEGYLRLAVALRFTAAWRWLEPGHSSGGSIRQSTGGSRCGAQMGKRATLYR